MTRSIVFTLLLINLLAPALPAQSDTVYRFVEETPTFPGGEEAMMRYLVANLQYPAVAREQGHQGIVYVRFVVETDGSLTNVRVDYGAHPSLDSAAVQVVKGMPLWIPAKHEGSYVRSEFVLPLQFQLHRNHRRSDRKATRRSR